MALQTLKLDPAQMSLKNSDKYEGTLLTMQKAMLLYNIYGIIID
jgi:hypothetical protein